MHGIGTPRIERNGQPDRRVVENPAIDERRQPLFAQYTAIGPREILRVRQRNGRERAGESPRRTHAEHQRLQRNILRVTEARVVGLVALSVLRRADVGDAQRALPGCRDGGRIIREVESDRKLLLELLGSQDRIAILPDVNG